MFVVFSMQHNLFEDRSAWSIVNYCVKRNHQKSSEADELQKQGA